MTEFENIAPPTGKLFPDAPASIKHDYEYEEFKASQALEGIPSSEIAGKMRAYEDLFQAWLKHGAVETLPRTAKFTFGFGWILRRLCKVEAKFTPTEIIGLASDPLRIFRMEIKELALAYAKELNDKQALTIQADLGRQLIKTQAQQQKFRQFLKEHFEADLERATALNKPLLELAAELLMRTK